MTKVVMINPVYKMQTGRNKRVKEIASTSCLEHCLI